VMAGGAQTEAGTTLSRRPDGLRLRRPTEDRAAP
jgi:hypothetical protein